MSTAARQQADWMPTIDRVPRPITALPVLTPRMLLPRRASKQAFPFSDRRTELFYLGRGAVWHAVKRLGLSGKEVLVPAYHHGVEVEALLDAGVHPRFYNVKRSFSADLQDIAQRITPETRAIYVTHYAGFPQPMDDILSIARARHLLVIEDCALALYSAHGSKPLGSRGDAAIFCLYKTLPIPHGGALWMSHEWERPALIPSRPIATAHQIVSSLLTRLEVQERRIGAHIRAMGRELARTMRSIRPLPVDARPVGGRTFAKGQEKLGISPWTARLARSLDATEIVEHRRRNFYALLGRIREASPPMIHELAPGVSPLFYPVWTKQKARVQALLASAGVESIDFWNSGSPLVKHGEFPDVDALREHVLELPIHQDLETEDITALAHAARQALAAVRQVR